MPDSQEHIWSIQRFNLFLENCGFIYSQSILISNRLFDLALESTGRGFNLHVKTFQNPNNNRSECLTRLTIEMTNSNDRAFLKRMGKQA